MMMNILKTSIVRQITLMFGWWALLLVLLQVNYLIAAQYDHFLYPVWHPSGDSIAVTDATKIRIYSSDFTQILDEYTLFSGSTPGLRVGHMAWSPNGEMLAVSLTGEDVIFRLQVWNLQTGQRVTAVTDFINTDVPFKWGSDSDRIAVVYVRDHGDSTIRILNIPSGTLAQEFTPEERAGIYAFDWSPMQNQAIIDIGGTHGGFYAVDTLVNVFEPINKSFQSIARFSYNPSGSLIAGVKQSDDKVLEVWDTTTFDVVATLVGHTSWIAGISWVDDELIATVADDETTRFWNVDTSQQTAIFETGFTSTPNFNPVANLFVASATDGLIYISEVQGGDVIATLANSNTPIANAGPAQTINDTDNNGTQLVTLDGSESTDSDGMVVSYSWKENGIEIATGVNPQIDLPLGIHTIRLTVTDNDGGASSDETTITVLHPPQ